MPNYIEPKDDGKFTAALQRPDMHQIETDEPPSAVNDFERVFTAVFYTVCAVAFVAIAVGILAALAAQ